VKKESNFCTRCGNVLNVIEKEVDESIKPDDPFENYVECHNCGASVPENNVCPVCGAHLRCDCGTIYKTGSKYCHSCGQPIPMPLEEEEQTKNYLECPKCKEKVPIGYSFCTNCGYNMEEGV
jgi:DNA-directed RNA polymerase subunit RPC12/RpoP